MYPAVWKTRIQNKSAGPKIAAFLKRIETSWSQQKNILGLTL